MSGRRPKPRQAAPGRTTRLHTITPAVAIDDPHLLGQGFRGASWARWRAVLKAACAERLTPEELTLFREVAERDPPIKRVRELWAIVGRRGGKDSIASAIAATAAMGTYDAYLRPGERATVLCLAVDRDQARIIKRYIAASFETNPLLRPMLEGDVRDDGFDLSNGVEVVISTNSFRAVRGRTIVCAIFDEAAYWRSEESANPDAEICNAVTPGLVTLPGAMLIGISSPYRRSGLLFSKWREHYGKNDDDVLVVRGTSRQFNPTLPQATIDAALARDPEAAAAEWLAEWRSDLADFLDRELVEAAVDAGVCARPVQHRHRYFAFCDPSGGRGDAFTSAIAHCEGNTVILDAVSERRPPFDPSNAVADVAALLRSYGIAEITGDRYAAEWVVEAFAKEGIAYQQSEKDRSALYLETLPLFTAGRVRLLDNARLVHQFSTLERRTSRIGRDRIDHPPGAHDDIANAVAGALVLTASELVPSLIRADDFLVNDAPAALPKKCDAVYASVALDQRGIAAVAYWARTRHRGVPLLLLDFDVAAFGQPLLRGTLEHLEELTATIQTVSLGIFSDDAVAAHSEAVGVLIEALGDVVTEPGALAIAAAVHVSAGRVKIAHAAHERSKFHPLRAALDARFIGRDDPLSLAVLYGIAAALQEQTAMAA